MIGFSRMFFLVADFWYSCFYSLSYYFSMMGTTRYPGNEKVGLCCIQVRKFMFVMFVFSLCLLLIVKSGELPDAERSSEFGRLLV